MNINTETVPGRILISMLGIMEDKTNSPKVRIGAGHLIMTLMQVTKASETMLPLEEGEPESVEDIASPNCLLESPKLEDVDLCGACQHEESEHKLTSYSPLGHCQHADSKGKRCPCECFVPF